MPKVTMVEKRIGYLGEIIDTIMRDRNDNRLPIEELAASIKNVKSICQPEEQTGFYILYNRTHHSRNFEVMGIRPENKAEIEARLNKERKIQEDSIKGMHKIAKRYGFTVIKKE